MILDRPNHFGWVPIILDRSTLFWSSLNRFGQVQIIKISPGKSNLNPTKMIWTRPKQFVPDQNNLYPSKTIWRVQNPFRPIEGQDINLHFHFWIRNSKFKVQQLPMIWNKQKLLTQYLLWQMVDHLSIFHRSPQHHCHHQCLLWHLHV